MQKLNTSNIFRNQIIFNENFPICSTSILVNDLWDKFLDIYYIYMKLIPTEEILTMHGLHLGLLEKNVHRITFSLQCYQQIGSIVMCFPMIYVLYTHISSDPCFSVHITGRSCSVTN